MKKLWKMKKLPCAECGAAKKLPRLCYCMACLQWQVDMHVTGIFYDEDLAHVADARLRKN